MNFSLKTAPLWWIFFRPRHCHGGTLLQGHRDTALREAIASTGAVEDQPVGLQQGLEKGTVPRFTGPLGKSM